MAAYIDSDDIDARVPTTVQLQALDDDADGVADTNRLSTILSDASRWVDAHLRRSTELDTPYPALAQQAALARAEWQIYERAGKTGDDNPKQEAMERYRDILDDLAEGGGDLDSAGGVVTGGIYDPEDDDDDPSLFIDPTGL